MDVTRILVPIDFSEHASLALDEAARLAKERNAQVTLMHVHEIVEMAFMDFTYVEPPTRLQTACDAAERRLTDMAHKLGLPDGRVRIAVVTGSPVLELIKASDDHDLIIMPTHGRKGMSHFLLGSVAERVVRGARCSVLVVKNAQTAHSATASAL